MKLARCGMEPALSLDSSAFCDAFMPEEPIVLVSEAGLGPLWRGLDEGVGLEVLGATEGWEPILFMPIGGKRDGTVPARNRRPADGAEDASWAD